MTDSVEAVLELMHKTFGGKYKQYFNGDPEMIARFDLPCIIVTQTRDDTTEGEMGEDDVTDSIRIKIVRDRAEDYTGQIDPLNTTEKKLRDAIGRRGADRKYTPGTVKHALRNMLLNGVEAIAPSMAVEYGVNPRETLGKADQYADWTAEAWVTFDIKYSVDTY